MVKYNPNIAVLIDGPLTDEQLKKLLDKLDELTLFDAVKVYYEKKDDE